MADDKSLTAMEKEAAHSWREWPIYIMMHLKRLQSIQESLRVSGETQTQIRRRENLLKAIHDMDGENQIKRPPPVQTDTGASNQEAGYTGDYDDDIRYTNE